MEALKKRMARKATFEAAAAELASLLQHHADGAGGPGDAAALVDGARRCATLLRTRHTGAAFWRAGSRVFCAALENAAALALGEEDARALADAKRAADAQLGAGAEAEGADAAAASSSAAEPSFLFEGQLSGADDQEPQVREHPVAVIGRIIAEWQAREAAAAAGGGLAEAAQAMESELDAGVSPPGLEEAIAASLAGDTATRGPPPASKRAVKELETIVLDEAALESLSDGQNVQCAVCCEELAVGDTVQKMPCGGSHCFHPPCLAPWLEQHNSCPICRFELPTDDVAYEREKQRRAEDERERAGVENALSHQEFVYV